jgi:hypothetical protein
LCAVEVCDVEGFAWLGSLVAVLAGVVVACEDGGPDVGSPLAVVDAWEVDAVFGAVAGVGGACAAFVRADAETAHALRSPDLQRAGSSALPTGVTRVGLPQ